LKSSGTKPESSETNGKSSGTRQKTSDKIIEMIKKDPKITAPQIAMELGISTRGVEKNLRQLRETGTLKRVGSPTFGGYWEIVNLDND
ncbi:MAG: HTH domain-containing protein, partial [Prevotella sp.]|nr:HTH domain-containing protein [Prevotella sp.]